VNATQYQPEEDKMMWQNKKTLVTGGASFIGSHLIDLLLEHGVPTIRVVDDLSSGHLENIQSHIDGGQVEFYKADLLRSGVAQGVLRYTGHKADSKFLPHMSTGPLNHWLEVRQETGEPPAESALVLIGRHFDEEELRREWADCIARP
jgi:hypothetical protein